MSQPVDLPTPTTDAAALGEALESVLSAHFGTPRRVVALELRVSPVRSSYILEEVDVRLDDGMVLALMLKHLGRGSMLEDARRAKPAFLDDPLREIDTYRAILTQRRSDTAVCYGAKVDPSAARYWLFLERLGGRELYQVGEIETWQRAARWAASWHAGFEADPDRPALAHAAHLLNYDRDFYWRWMARARAFARRGSARNQVEWLASLYGRVVDLLLSCPVTVIHGELYASNVLVEGEGESLRICPIDWEMAAIGPGLIDLAALTAGSWTEEQRMAMVLSYHARRVAEGGQPKDLDSLLPVLDGCRLHLAIRYLGWSPAWSPPSEHAYNWLDEALRLAEDLRS
jgi:Phosphotransferase enzyme family